MPIALLPISESKPPIGASTAGPQHMARVTSPASTPTFLFGCCGDPRDLHKEGHSFPTRRSSDLTAPGHAPGLLLGRCDDAGDGDLRAGAKRRRSEEHTSELQSPFLISYAVFC